jgi:hypothetical protein
MLSDMLLCTDGGGTSMQLSSIKQHMICVCDLHWMSRDQCHDGSPDIQILFLIDPNS